MVSTSRKEAIDITGDDTFYQGDDKNTTNNNVTVKSSFGEEVTSFIVVAVLIFIFCKIFGCN